MEILVDYTPPTIASCHISLSPTACQIHAGVYHQQVGGGGRHISEGEEAALKKWELANDRRGLLIFAGFSLSNIRYKNLYLYFLMNFLSQKIILNQSICLGGKYLF